MAKIAVVTDTHAGARNDSPVVAAYFGRFWRDVFFPKIDEFGIKQVLHSGDMVDRRRYLNYGTLQGFTGDFINPCVERGLNVDWLVGNHDTTYKNTNRLNASEAIKFPGLRVFTEPTEVVIDGRPLLYLPWICEETEAMSLRMITNTRATVAFGHLELSGFVMHKGAVPNSEGLTADTFNGFEFVGTGHFHHKSSQGNIHYLGAPYEMTWADYNDPRGFHIFDTTTATMEFIQNPYRLFYRLVYDDRANDYSYIQQFLEALRPDTSIYRGAFVKLVVKHKHNPVWHDMVMDALYKVGAEKIEVIDEYLAESVAIVAAEEAGVSLDTYTPPPDDTLSLMDEYVNEVFPDSPTGNGELLTLLQTLYGEAMAEMANA